MACMYRVYVYNEVSRYNDMYLVWADNAMDVEVKCKDRLDEETDEGAIAYSIGGVAPCVIPRPVSITTPVVGTNVGITTRK